METIISNGLFYPQNSKFNHLLRRFDLKCILPYEPTNRNGNSQWTISIYLEQIISYWNAPDVQEIRRKNSAKSPKISATPFIGGSIGGRKNTNLSFLMTLAVYKFLAKVFLPTFNPTKSSAELSSISRWSWWASVRVFTSTIYSRRSISYWWPNSQTPTLR